MEAIKIEQTLFSNNYELPQETLIIINKAFFQETLFRGQRMVIAMNDQKGWQINPYSSKEPILLTNQEIENYSIASRYLSPLYNFYYYGGKLICRFQLK